MGVFGAELEVVPARVAKFLTENSSLIMLGMGAGKYTDAQYLFTEDICGYGVNHKPRHGKVYAELGPKLKAIQDERVSAMKAFKSDVDAGGYPEAGHTIPIKDDEFVTFMQKVGAQCCASAWSASAQAGITFIRRLSRREGCELSGIVARAEATVAKARADWPEVPIYPSLAAVIEAGVCDAVTITTPPHTRRELVLEAIETGLHVIADKPFAQNSKGAMELDAAAKAKGVTPGVYQNRRFDADLQTLKKVIDNGRAGTVWRTESRMDQNSPHTVEAGHTGG
ncbi:MAG: 3-methyl-2-oxobutanoate hydroxymethyltransferase [Silicimonas sp.]|nr:3-methyl-2-oxobutanoate hydroxymethyltransferase [Silicimonas sp.]